MQGLGPGPTAERVGYMLKVAQNALRARMDEALKPLGITAPQYAVLAAIGDEPGITSAALARVAFVTPQTMQGIVANLERAGLLARSGDPERGRVLRAVLTDEGRGTLARAHALTGDIERRMTAGLTISEVAGLTAMLARCAANLLGRGG